MRQTDELTNGQMDERMDGWRDRLINRLMCNVYNYVASGCAPYIKMLLQELGLQMNPWYHPPFHGEEAYRDYLWVGLYKLG